MKGLVFPQRGLKRAIGAIAAAGGSEPAEAELVGDNLVTANLTGHDSHGIGMMPRYVEALLEGGLHPNRKVEVKLDGGSLLALDGGAGYGQSIGLQATRLGIERARRHGVAVVTLGNSHHLGRIGHWAEMAVDEGLVSIHFVNVLSFARVAAYGGADGRFGTNPLCIALPGPAPDRPIIADMATSRIAMGKVRVARNKGDKIAEGTLLDAEGKPTTDPNVMYQRPRGALLTFAEHKGYALAFICELLGGALTGTGATSGGRQFANGMLAFYVDPKVIDTSNYFDEEISRYTDFIRETKPITGVESVLVPGDPERKMRAERTKNGVPLPDDTWAAIVNTAREVGVSEASIQRAAS